MNSLVLGVRARTWITGAMLLVLAGFLAMGALPGVAEVKKAEPLAKGEQAASYAKTLSAAFREAADEVLPAVVMIRNTPKLAARSSSRRPPREPLEEFEGTPFEDFFGQRPELRRFFRELPSIPSLPDDGAGGIGSGVMIDASGLILTNNHVVAGGGDIVVRLHDGREFKAVEVKTDPRTDLAVVRIEGAKDLKVAKLGDSDQAMVGDWVLALGDPFGLEGTVTAGIISAKGRGLGIADRENFIQTDAAINPGNSGGPLVNLDGEVVAINTAIHTRSGGNQGVGFAIPINLAKWVSDQLVKEGVVRRAYLGVMIQPVTHQLAEQFGVKAKEGVLVSNVQEGTPAEKAGLKPGDVIVEFAGQPVASPQQLQGVVEQTAINQKANMVVVRDGKRVTLNVTVKEQPSDYGTASMRRKQAEQDDAESSRFEKLGMEVETLTAEVAERLGVKADHGVVITGVESGSLADRAGLETGMVIVEAGRKPVKSVENLEKVITDEALQKGLLLLVRTQAGSNFVVLRGEK
ncbi:MAG: Do family serine endopeptidase [Pirellulales bacterium]|nr:Do family serine endopeptidase [Pirellulales bacterium]